MEYLIRFMINFFDLAIFWYCFQSFNRMRRVPKALFASCLAGMAAVWAAVNTLGSPLCNLFTLTAVLWAASLFFAAKLWSRLVNIAIFIGAGILFEPVGVILLHAMDYSPGTGEEHKYYFVAALCSFIRGNTICILSRLVAGKGLRLHRLPKEIGGVLVMVSGFAVLNCCSILLLTLESGSPRSLLMCLSILVSIVLTYYFMYFMMERFHYLMQKQHEDDLYREEMYYKEAYYEEMEKHNDYVQNVKHDLNNKLLGLYYLAEQGDMEALSEQLGGLCRRLGQTDACRYSGNPVVDSVLRVKLGAAGAEGIEVDADMLIPEKMQLDYGDIGVLYGNLLDNAIEACARVPAGRRFIRLENRYLSGKLLLVITNSKTGERNEGLRTTKKDARLHGRGIGSVRRVAEKYNGTVCFTDKGEFFEASVMLYGIEAGQ